MLQYLTAVSRYKEQSLQSQQHGQEVQWMEWGCEYSWRMKAAKPCMSIPQTGSTGTGSQFAPWQNKPGPPGSAPDESPVNDEEGDFPRLTFIPHDKSLICNLLGWSFFFICMSCKAITWLCHCFCTTKHLFILLWEALVSASTCWAVWEALLPSDVAGLDQPPKQMQRRSWVMEQGAEFVLP